jgi:hypothetical protein
VTLCIVSARRRARQFCAKNAQVRERTLVDVVVTAVRGIEYETTSDPNCDTGRTRSRLNYECNTHAIVFLMVGARARRRRTSRKMCATRGLLDARRTCNSPHACNAQFLTILRRE